jgi:hypothetical protein
MTCANTPKTVGAPLEQRRRAPTTLAPIVKNVVVGDTTTVFSCRRVAGATGHVGAVPAAPSDNPTAERNTTTERAKLLREKTIPLVAPAPKFHFTKKV